MKKQDALIFSVNLVFIAMALFLAQFSNIDISLQNYFFDFENNNWFFDAQEPVKKFIFYIFPKILLGISIFVLLIIVLFFGFKKKYQYLFLNRYKFLVILLGFIFIPLIAGNIKKFTNIYCPKQLEIYGGNREYVKIFDEYRDCQDKDFILKDKNKICGNVKKGQCFPAGHPVTAFSLFILFFVLEKKSNKVLSLFGALFLGSMLSFYQIAKGAHFFSDCLLSMLVCFLLAQLISLKFLPQNKANKFSFAVDQR